MYSQEYYNWCNIQLLLINKISEKLRIIFKNLWNQKFNKKWNNSKNDGNLFINGIGKSIYKKALKMQKEILKNGDTEFWDLSTLLLIFRESKLSQDITFLSNIEKLTKIRNEFAHHPTGNIDKPKFEYYWKEICDVLIYLGASYNKLEKIKQIKIQKIEFGEKVLQIIEKDDIVIEYGKVLYKCMFIIFSI
jgi:hypothetical protein